MRTMLAKQKKQKIAAKRGVHMPTPSEPEEAELLTTLSAEELSSSR